MVVYTFDLSPREADRCISEFKARLVYRASSGKARYTKKPCLERKEKKRKEKKRKKYGQKVQIILKRQIEEMLKTVSSP